jgi:acetate kinase
MVRMRNLVLSLNAGSSSIRFAFHDTDQALRRCLSGKVDGIGGSDITLLIDAAESKQPRQYAVAASNYATAITWLVQWLVARPEFAATVVVGHRVVHGMQHSAPQRVTTELLAQLRGIMPFDPEHLPQEIALIEAMQAQRAAVPQVVCFDTAFHRSMPRVARLMPIPRRYQAMGVERYGFHGLSYAYLLEELQRVDAPTATTGRVILAHLGSGASLAAIRAGQCVDTSMGFTPASGLVMSTRTGDIDPGLIHYLTSIERMSTAQFQHMVNHESGLLGVSGRSADLRELLAHEATDLQAADAVELFCYQVRKWLGSFAAVLGGLDTLVFTGGIGEHAAVIRQRICAGLEFLGIELSALRNDGHAPVISTAASRVTVRVMTTDEELMIARAASRLLQSDTDQ